MSLQELEELAYALQIEIEYPLKESDRQKVIEDVKYMTLYPSHFREDSIIERRESERKRKGLECENNYDPITLKNIGLMSNDQILFLPDKSTEKVKYIGIDRHPNTLHQLLNLGFNPYNRQTLTEEQQTIIKEAIDDNQYPIIENGVDDFLDEYNKRIKGKTIVYDEPTYIRRADKLANLIKDRLGTEDYANIIYAFATTLDVNQYIYFFRHSSYQYKIEDIDRDRNDTAAEVLGVLERYHEAKNNINVEQGNNALSEIGQTIDEFMALTRNNWTYEELVENKGVLDHGEKRIAWNPMLYEYIFSGECSISEQYTIDEHGIRNGPFKRWTSNGDLSVEGNMKNGKYEGEIKKHNDGMLAIDLYDNGDLLSGVTYFHNGDIMNEGKYYSNKPVGKWKVFDPVDHSYVGDTIYEDGKVKNGYFYDYIAQILSFGHKRDYKSEGVIKCFKICDGKLILFSTEYWMNGEFHRTDGPAIEWPSGNKWWYQHGKRHRTDGPAVDYDDGHKAWFLNGERHRTDGPAIEFANGDKKWYLNGKLHRTDGPSVVDSDGYQSWYQNGELHRTDGPAVIWNNVTKKWYLNGKLHRTDGPAIVYANGNKMWYQNGKRHRTDGPAIEQTSGDQEWYQNGKLHREGGPAIEYSGESTGDKEWRLNGELHRTDGPAVVCHDGNQEWYQNGELHRTDGPAVEHANGEHEYWKFGSKVNTPYFQCRVNKDGKTYHDVNGKLHRENGPAIEHLIKLYYIHGCIFAPDENPVRCNENKLIEWKVDGKLHRDNDRPSVIHDNGNMEWWTNGQRNREGDLPAIKWRSGAEEWWKNGERHRDCGPAVTNAVTKLDSVRVQCHRPTDKYVAYHRPGWCEWWIDDEKIEPKVIGIVAKESSTIIEKLSEYKNYRVVDDIVLQFIDSGDYSVRKYTFVCYIDENTTEKELIKNYITIRNRIFDERKLKVRPIFICSSDLPEVIKNAAKEFSPTTFEENDIDKILQAIKSV